MEGYDVQRLGLILSIQAEIEGMLSLNRQCKFNKVGNIYQQEDFEKKAEDLRNAIYTHPQQLFG